MPAGVAGYVVAPRHEVLRIADNSGANPDAAVGHHFGAGSVFRDREGSVAIELDAGVVATEMRGGPVVLRHLEAAAVDREAVGRDQRRPGEGVHEELGQQFLLLRFHGGRRPILVLGAKALTPLLQRPPLLCDPVDKMTNAPTGVSPQRDARHRNGAVILGQVFGQGFGFLESGAAGAAFDPGIEAVLERVDGGFIEHGSEPVGKT